MQASGTSTIYRWYVVAVLWAVFIVSYFDRFLMGLMVDPIKASLNLNDFQMGLLLGPAFTLFQVVCGLPLGWYADRSNRKWLLIGGILIWCAMTTGSAFVFAFAPLFLLRLGLGLGESVVSPTSISIISDYFDRQRRPRAISVYLSGTYLGAGLAFLIGGNLVGWLERRGADHHILGLGPFEPWQAAFLIVGLPGFLFAALMLSVREPERQEVRAATAAGAAASGITRYILERWKGFGVLFVASSCNFALSALTFWNVPLFKRVWGWDVATTGTATGLLYFTAGPIGTVLTVWLAKKLVERYPTDGTLRLLLIGLLIGVPMSALFPVMPSPELAVAVMFLAFVGKGIATAAGPASLAQILPGDLRVRGVAVFNAIIAVIGAMLGPPIIGWATDRTGDPGMIGVVMTGFVLVIGLPAIVIVALGLGQYRRTLAAMEQTLATTLPPKPAMAAG